MSEEKPKKTKDVEKVDIAPDAKIDDLISAERAKLAAKEKDIDAIRKDVDACETVERAMQLKNNLWASWAQYKPEEFDKIFYSASIFKAGK